MRKSRAPLIEINGETLTAKEWADRIGISRQSIYKRISEGWPRDRAFTEKPTVYTTYKDRFLATVFRKTVVGPGGCWLWQGRKDRDGYGMIRHNFQELKTHRLSHEVFIGPIPDGFQIDHLCQVKSCCNPRHIEAVTHRENVQRAWALRRQSGASNQCTGAAGRSPQISRHQAALLRGSGQVDRLTNPGHQCATTDRRLKARHEVTQCTGAAWKDTLADR